MHPRNVTRIVNWRLSSIPESLGEFRIKVSQQISQFVKSKDKVFDIFLSFNFVALSDARISSKPYIPHRGGGFRKLTNDFLTPCSILWKHFFDVFVQRMFFYFFVEINHLLLKPINVTIHVFLFQTRGVKIFCNFPCMIHLMNEPFNVSAKEFFGFCRLFVCVFRLRTYLHQNCKDRYCANEARKPSIGCANPIDPINVFLRGEVPSDEAHETKQSSCVSYYQRRKIFPFHDRSIVNSVKDSRVRPFQQIQLMMHRR